VSDGYTILSLDELETARHRGNTLIPVRHALGFQVAGVNAWKGNAGEGLVPPHEEDNDNEELYAVVSGRASFTVGEEEADAPAGTLVFLPQGVFRTAVATEDGTIVLVVGGRIGEAFDASGWEEFALADTYRQDGEIDKARALMADVVAKKPGYWATHYNAACFEALAGNPDEAFAHLRRARELDQEGASEQYFREDSDLDSLRDDPRFPELLA
jgi:mannose-6-phosphate isomerase-like protein (cupin superfamily)